MDVILSRHIASLPAAEHVLIKTQANDKWANPMERNMCIVFVLEMNAEYFTWCKEIETEYTGLDHCNTGLWYGMCK